MTIKKLFIFIFLIMSMLAFSQTDSRYDAGMNLPFNEKAGDVNPQTGNLSLGATDVQLPGRGGLHFAFSRSWHLNRSNVFNMYYDEGRNKLSSNTIEGHYRMGAGWSYSLPYIKRDTESGSLVMSLFYGGGVYEIDQTGVAVDDPNASNLLGYDLVDMRVYEDGAVGYTDFTAYNRPTLRTDYGLNNLDSIRSTYVLHLKTNEQYWFDANGNLIMNQDKTGLNRVWYFYDADNKLRLVVDTIGRKIEFMYDGNDCLSEITWQVSVGTKHADGTRTQEVQSRSVRYTYESVEDSQKYPASYALYDSDSVINYRTPYVLTMVTDQMGNNVRYEYEEKTAEFTYNKEMSKNDNVHLLLTGITDNYTESVYKNQRMFDYAVPVTGMYKKWFYNGYMEYFKISREYYHNRHGEVMNDTTYVYHNNEELSDYNGYRAIISQGGVTTTYTYSLDDAPNLHQVLDSLLIETTDGFSELRDYVYNNKRAKELMEVRRSGTTIYNESYSYDVKGNLKAHVDRMGLLTTSYYDDTYSIPLQEIKTLDVDGAETQYVTSREINGLGQVTVEKMHLSGKETIMARMTYDAYGNPVTQTDALGNTTYTVYDGTYHAFPVKTYFHTSIASWANGNDVHANWLTDPDGTKKVRIRSWKVFNTDGSVWIEVDNEGYAIEHYYDALGTEIETVNPDLDDVTGFAQPIAVDNTGIPISGTDFDDFQASSYFGSFLSSRTNNPGARMEVDYLNDYVRIYADIDVALGYVKSTGKQGNGLRQPEEEIEYGPDGVEYKKMMVYDDLGRMIALIDPDAELSTGAPIRLKGGIVLDRYDKMWIVKYDDLGREVRVEYPKTRKLTDVKTIIYDDVNNITTTIDPERRVLIEKRDWNGNVIEVTRKERSDSGPEGTEVYSFKYDQLKRKVKFTDAMGLVTEYRYDERNLLIEQIYHDKDLTGKAFTASDVMTYDVKGQLITKTDRKGQVITFVYDEMGRNTSAVHYTSGDDYTNGIINHTVNMAYDNRGNAVRIDNQNLIEHYIYDYGNRVITLERRLKDADLRALISNDVWNGDAATQVFAFDYIYNDAGMVTRMTYPDGGVHDFDYDGVLGRLQTINEGINAGDVNAFITGIAYNNSGVATEMNYANGTTQTWEFDNRKRISHLNITDPGATEIVDLNYTLNGIGDVLKINDNEYGYDGFGRIIDAKTRMPDKADRLQLVRDAFGTDVVNTYTNGSVFNEAADLNNDGRVNGADYLIASYDDRNGIYDIEGFTYDKNGNRLTLEQNGDVYRYIYKGRNRLQSIYQTKKGESVERLFARYEYDANGNTTKRTIYIHEKDAETGDYLAPKEEIIVFEYDTMNRLVRTIENKAGVEHTTEYLYDNAGNRFVKVAADKTGIYLRHGQIAVAMDIEINSGAGDGFPVSGDVTTDVGRINRYVLSGDLLAGRITTNFTRDLTTGVVTNTIEKYWYHLDHLNSTKAVTKEDGSLDVLYEYRAFGEELKKLGSGDAKYTYGGKELDGETNLYYFNARYYDATIGRFINVDPVQDGTNWYVYCSNNPLNMIDPTGLKDYSIVTNGTILFGKGDRNEKLTPDNYFMTNAGKFDSNKAASEISNMLGTDEGVFMGWKGKNNNYGKDEFEGRKTAAVRIANEIMNNKKYNNQDDTFTLVGHSHGGNVMIDVANILEKNGYNVPKLITLNAPVRGDFELNNTKGNINHIQTFGDSVQKLGGIFPGTGKQMFPAPVTNIDVRNFQDARSEEIHNAMKRNSYSPNYNHQVTRSVEFLHRMQEYLK